MARSVLINCAYSPLNLGDAAIVTSMRDAIRGIDPTATVRIHTFTESEGLFRAQLGLDAHPGIFVLPAFHNRRDRLRWLAVNSWVAATLLVGGQFGRRGVAAARDLLPARPRRAVSRMLASDVVVAAGGGYLTDEFRFLPFLLLEIWVSSRMRPTLLGSQTLGPLHSPLSRWLVRLALREVDEIQVRDDYSLAIGRDVARGAPPGRAPVIRRVPDYAFAFDRVDEGAAATLSPAPVVAVSVRSWHFPHVVDPAASVERYRGAVAGAVTRLAEAGNSVALIATNYPGHGSRDNDLLECREILGRVAPAHVASVWVASEAATPPALRGLLQGCALLIATRMHAAIFALSLGVPVLVIAYQPKGIAMMQMLGCDCDAIDASAVTVEWLMDRASRYLDPGSARQLEVGAREGLAARAREGLQAWISSH